jgi:hypothetical protein
LGHGLDDLFAWLPPARLWPAPWPHARITRLRASLSNVDWTESANWLGSSVPPSSTSSVVDFDNVLVLNSAVNQAWTLSSIDFESLAEANTISGP